MSLELVTPVNDVFRRDYTVADTTLLDPTTTNAYVEGEWVLLDSNGKAARVTLATERAPKQIWTQKGDFAAQALGKICALELHEYEADTDMFDGAGVYAVGTELTVKSVTIDGVVRAALAVAASTNLVHAICTKIPSTNGGKLRFMKRAPFVKP